MMDSDGDQSLFNIINTFTNGIELDDNGRSGGGASRVKENGKMFTKHNVFGPLNGGGGLLAAAESGWPFGLAHKKSINDHHHHNHHLHHHHHGQAEVAGSIGNSDKSISSFGSESNDSNGGESSGATGPINDSLISSCLTESFIRQLRDNSQSPAFFGFSSSNSSSPPLSQNSSGPSSASSLSEAGTTSTLKFSNSTTPASSSTSATMANNNGNSSLMAAASAAPPTSFNSFAQAVAKCAFASATNSGSPAMANPYDNVFGMSSHNNIIDSIDSFGSFLTSDLDCVGLNGTGVGGHMQQQSHHHLPSAAASRRFSAQGQSSSGLLPTSFSQDSLPHLFQNTSSSAASTFNAFSEASASQSSTLGGTLPSLSNNRKLSFLTSSVNVNGLGGSNSPLSSPILPASANNNNNNSNNSNSIFNGSSPLDSPNMLSQSKFEAHMRAVTNEINNTVQHYQNALLMRKDQLMKQMEHIRNAYVLMLSQNKGKPLEKMPIHAIRFTHPEPALYKSIASLGFLYSPAFGPYCQASGEGLSISIEGEPTCFMINIKNCFNEEILTGGDTVEVEVQPLEMNAGQSNGSLLGPQIMSSIQKNILDNNNGNYNVTYIIPRGSGIRSVKISININGLPVSGAPFHAVVKKERAGETWKRIAIFGEEGTEAGKFCRPWGVALSPLPLKVDPAHKVDMVQSIPIHSKPFYNWTGAQPGRKDFLVAVADRSNNRIQFLKLSVPEPEKRDIFGAPPGFGAPGSNGGGNNGGVDVSVIHMFGSGPGTRSGQFDRPAGLAINSNLGHLVVADKDNHRVQVFDLAGNFQFKFGEKGSRAGQFCYPWDVATCPQTSLILVSDTRNRRIQLFTHYGQYLWHCGQPLDSPRGVAFLTPERYIVSDFNKHRLLIIDKNESRMQMHNGMPMAERPGDLINSKYIGFGEGSAWGEFLRPQGLVASLSRGTFGAGKPTAVHVICADSRNNRIALWNSLNQNFEYIGEDSLRGDNISPTCFDRPSGIAISGNILAVVDFGFNRIQIFRKSAV